MPFGFNFLDGALHAVFLDLDVGGVIGPGASATGNIIFALHTADPHPSGDQQEYECTYTSYDRVTVAASATEFSISGPYNGLVTILNDVVFPRATGGSETATHWSITVDGDTLLYSGALSTPIIITSGVRPKILAGSTLNHT
jgi:hypothetical protein